MEVKRKDLQKQQQQVYGEKLQQGSSSSVGGRLVFDVRNDDPRSAAAEADVVRRATLNRQLSAAVGTMTCWQDAAAVLATHAGDLNYLLVAQIFAKLPELMPQEAVAGGSGEGYGEQRPSKSGSGGAGVGSAAHSGDSGAEQRAAMVAGLSDLAMRHMGSFQFWHLSQVAAGLGACRLGDPELWAALLQASSRRLASATLPQLATLSAAAAVAGYVPSLNWVQACELQAGRQLHSAGPEPAAALMWAWGCFAHTPSKRFMDAFKMRSRALMRDRQLAPSQLLQVLYGVARLTEHHPGEHWMLGWANAFAPHMGTCHPHVLVEALVALVSLQFQPSQAWVSNAVRHIAPGLEGGGPDAKAGTGAPQQPVLPTERTTTQGQVAHDSAGQQSSSSSMEEHQCSSPAPHCASTVPPPDLLQLMRLSHPAPWRVQPAATPAATAQVPPDSASLQSPEQPPGQQQALSVAALWRSQQHELRLARPEALGASEVAQLAWCLDALDYLPDPAWMSAFVTRAEACLPRTDSAALADVLQGLAGVDFLPDAEFLGAVSARLRVLLPSMPAEALARTMRALSRLGFAPERACMAAMASRVDDVAAQLGPLGLPDVLTALAYLGPMARTLDGSVLTGSRGEEILEATASQQRVSVLLAAVEPLLPSVPPDRLGSLGWALAVLDHKPPSSWLHEWLVCCRAQLKLLDARDLATVGWAAACLRHRPGSAWLEDYAREAGRRMRFYDAQALTDLCWALASFGFTPSDDWMEALEQEVEARCEASASPPASKAPGTGAYCLTPHQMAVVLWALQSFKWVPRNASFVGAVSSLAAEAVAV